MVALCLGSPSAAPFLPSVITVASPPSVPSSTLTSSIRVSEAQVRMSPDHKRAHVRWTALPGREQAAAHDLQRSAVTLRQAVSRLLGLKHTPALLFHSTALAPEDAGIEAAFEAR